MFVCTPGRYDSATFGTDTCKAFLQEFGSMLFPRVSQRKETQCVESYRTITINVALHPRPMRLGNLNPAKLKLSYKYLVSKRHFLGCFGDVLLLNVSQRQGAWIYFSNRMLRPWCVRMHNLFRLTTQRHFLGSFKGNSSRVSQRKRSRNLAMYFLSNHKENMSSCFRCVRPHNLWGSLPKGVSSAVSEAFTCPRFTTRASAQSLFVYYTMNQNSKPRYYLSSSITRASDRYDPATVLRQSANQAAFPWQFQRQLSRFTTRKVKRNHKNLMKKIYEKTSIVLCARQPRWLQPL